MPNFHVSIRKAYNGYNWVNAYQVAAENLDSAVAVGSLLVERERPIHLDIVSFVNLHVALMPQVSPATFVNVPLEGNGGRATGSYAAAAPQDCAFVEFGTSTGRPGKKFYRYCWLSSEILGSGDSAIVISSHTGTINTQTAGMIADAGSEEATLTVGKYFRVMTGSTTVKYGACDTHHGWFNRASGA